MQSGEGDTSLRRQRRTLVILSILSIYVLSASLKYNPVEVAGVVHRSTNSTSALDVRSETLNDMLKGTWAPSTTIFDLQYPKMPLSCESIPNFSYPFEWSPVNVTLRKLSDLAGCLHPSRSLETPFPNFYTTL
jgi:hypothetical protein